MSTLQSQVTPNPSNSHSQLSSFTPTKSHLLSLFKSKQYKSFKMYIVQLNKQNQKAEKAISQLLTEIFVEKKYKEPVIMFSGLVFYKNLITSAILDYLCQDSLFPQNIHKEIGDICKHRGKERDMQKRGQDYFTSTFNIQQNEQNASYGYNFVLLALQIVKSISLWYPFDYLSPQNRSIFKKIYDSLLETNVYFPSQVDFAFMKPNDKDLFVRNYQNYKKIMQALLEEEKKEQQDEIMIKVLEPIKEEKGQSWISSGFEQGNSMNIVSSLGLETPGKIRDKEVHEEEKIVESQKKKEEQINSKQQTPKTQYKQKPNLFTQSMTQQLFCTPPKTQRIDRPATTSKKEQKKKKKEAIPFYQSVETQPHQQERLLSKKSQSHRSLPKTQRIRDYPTSSKSRNLVQQPLSSFKSKLFQPPLDPSQLNFMISQKLSLTLSQSALNRKELNIQDAISKYKDLTSIFYKIKLRYDICQLSDKKYKPLHLGMLDLRNEALKLYDYSSGENPFYRGDKLEARLIKENGYNFRLVLRNMSDQSLVIAFKDMSKYKYSNQIRIISWGNKKLHNFNSMYQDFSIPFGQSVGPSQLKLNKISEKYLTYASHCLPKQSYLDIRFTFFITDPGMKFLPFDLSVNGRDFFLILPLTILDVCSIRQQFSAFELEQYAFGSKGNLITTPPFTIRQKQLPQCFGSFQFKDFYPKTIDYLHYNLIGCLKMQIPTESYIKKIKKSIYIVVRLVSYPKRIIELMTVYKRYDQEQDNFAKEVLNLFMFLMMEAST